ncbi:COPI associated protein-domain-containing protein [Hyaloraphidium curvatum]|nr:COPI associated protein-domain-containing protein [Hyaloraphidium curvatum]
MPADASKNEKQARLIWKIVDTVVALLLIITVILLWVYYPSWQTVVTGLFVMALGILLAVCNFKVMPIAKKFALFLFTPLGRGLSYFFIGSFVVVANWWWVILVGIIVMGVGIVYIITAFVKIPYLETTHLDDEAA